MKKLFYAMMLVALVIALPSCGGNEEDEPKKDTKADVTFWTDDDDCIEEIEVNLWKYDDTYDEYRYISSYYTSTPDCGDDGCANFYDVKYGDYYYWAENDYYEWEGELVVDASCEKVKLYVSRARVKSAVPADAPKMEAAAMEFDLNTIVNN